MNGAQPHGYESTYAEVSGYTASAGASQLYSESYTRDNLGRISQRTEVLQGVTTVWVYSYDLAGRLSRVDRNGTLFESYTYDANDNRLSVTRPSGTTSATFDNQDRILANGTTTFTHDSNGDLLTRTDGFGTTVFDFDTTGQLVSLTKPNGQFIGYELDATNKRAVKRINSIVQRKWLYASGLLPVAEYDSSDNLTTVFNGGYVVKNGTSYRLLRDHLGSVRLVVDASTGVVAQRLSYSPWGEVLEDTNPGFQPFGFAGGQYDPDTGLVRFGTREYDAILGRWVTKDEAGLDGGPNLYRYCSCNPINLFDPTGFQEEEYTPIKFSDWMREAFSWERAKQVLNGFGDAYNLLNPGEYAKDAAVEAVVNSGGGAGGGGGVPDLVKTVSAPKKTVVRRTFKGAAAKGFDWDHIFSGHMKGGTRCSPSKTLFPEAWTENQVKRAVKNAWASRELTKTLSSQNKQIFRGKSDGLLIEMLFNPQTKIVETAYPIFLDWPSRLRGIGEY